MCLGRLGTMFWILSSYSCQRQSMDCRGQCQKLGTLWAKLTCFEPHRFHTLRTWTKPSLFGIMDAEFNGEDLRKITKRYVDGYDQKMDLVIVSLQRAKQPQRLNCVKLRWKLRVENLNCLFSVCWKLRWDEGTWLVNWLGRAKPNWEARSALKTNGSNNFFP